MPILGPLGYVAGSAILGAGSNLLSNIFGAASTSSTNKNNLKINQMNNAFNERMMQKQMDYNTMMWEKQNEYNSPEGMRARGINPYASMMGGNFGSAQAQGVSAASAASAAPQQAFHPNFQGIPESILMAQQGAKLIADTHGQIIDNQTRATKNLQELANLRAEAMTKEARAALDRTINSQTTSLMLNQIAESRQRQSMMRAQEENILREGLLLDKNLAIFDERTKLEMAQLSANTLLASARMGFTKQQTIHEIQKMYLTVAQKNGVKLSTDTAKRMADDLVEKARVEADLAPYTYGPQNMYSASYGVGYQFDRNKR